MEGVMKVSLCEKMHNNNLRLVLYFARNDKHD